VKDNMRNKKQLTFLEMVEEGRKEKGIIIKHRNEPNMKLMAEAAINLYHQTY
jgi:hypothetical protein